MSVTIKDVAKRANVAPSTVSRVISDSPKISERTKRKVRKVMEEMGYHLNYNARVLVQRSTKTIGIVMKNSASQSLHNPFVPEVIRGISSSCRQLDYSINLTTGESEEAIFEDVVKMVQGKRVDGLIVLYSKKDDKVVPYLKENGIPFVVVGKPMTGSSTIMSVDNDNIQAAQEVTEYLIGLGHKRIAYIGQESEFQFAKDRLNGYLAAMQEHDLKPDEDYYLKSFHFDREKGKQVVEKLMALPEPPTGLIVTDDINAMIVLLVLQEMDIKVPDEVSVVGFNNTIVSTLSSPALTSVDTQTYQLGHESARSLIELINDPGMFKKSVIIPTVLEIRESCAPCKEVIEPLTEIR
ncbi:LacI family DNA-binding transcriptional regulator [Sediminibacillus massiliensis]|uniref:LacI family DNA-binding transcriptional regulator n=1 Tax=Sediminibacillus massiliensis TaxID=1926277 RepID=UPI00098881BC|nr:LacI family DNA-binding transcriptional regulator [Sediminibacillus massiliensis]